MLNNIVFMGGIHGVGKSTICKEICDLLNLQYLSASDLIKWKDLNDDANNKKVTDVTVTQDRLIIGLANNIQKDRYYLLDGHYCLLNSSNDIVNVPLDTFKQIKPISLNLIVGDIAEIKRRLENRDGRPYDYGLLEQMQKNELHYAGQLSKTLGISLNVGTQNEYSKLLNSLNNTLLTLR